MLHFLCGLWRENRRVTFYESAGHTGLGLFGAADRGGQQSVLGAPRVFAGHDDICRYLRHWIAEPAARNELRWMLQNSGASLLSTGPGDDGWLHALAGRIAGGAIVVLDEPGPRAMPGRLVAPAASAAAASASSLAALPSLASLPQAPAVVPLLPALEEVRIEGAEVLPELDQSLEAVKLAVAKFSGASLSLDPASDRVAQIGASATDAAERARQALASL